ncbi:hypothetical protein F8O06_04925 [Pseudoclavibacter sp. CFCC 14310]|uniref:hypothetical protein n=1 Tax=Pseudoclavibacter sp. CFCC 14310 TaxID=2615180 RepID=UPI001301651E|nr:hypothetical protein [Pseudoclavibacter sp. CFCC 14310]KAB1645432.1 hypothetical protein F8O06_07520 [Pseudoclavibacter sp. CFCC 14310]KAB1646109.1 hypothetical protein F8O06_04925 [Pseudoclavibacter sp. CFCC 14310]
MTTDNPSGFAEQLHQMLDRAGLTEEADDGASSERFGTALRDLQGELERDGFDLDAKITGMPKPLLRLTLRSDAGALLGETALTLGEVFTDSRPSNFPVPRIRSWAAQLIRSWRQYHLLKNQLDQERS